LQHLGYSWGRVHHLPPTTSEAPAYTIDATSSNWHLPTLAVGLRRSYGDSCLNHRGHVIDTTFMNHIKSFDMISGVIECAAGISLGSILQSTVNRGWFLPVSPGTKFVTLGGAIANDIHGKNHHVHGTLGRHILELDLLRSDGSQIKCSPSENQELFRATVGGLGLTGLILNAKIKLIPIGSQWIDSESIRFSSIDEFFKINEESNDFTYTVAWIDCFSAYERQLKGIFMRGEHHHAAKENIDINRWNHPKWGIPFNFPKFALNYATMRIFNEAYYRRLPRQHTKAVMHFDPFFYPLDAINNWNRIYGHRGLFQYQYTIPEHNSEAVIETLRVISAAKQGSFLAVLKKFGDIKSPGMMSFPSPGYTLTLDFPNAGIKSFRLFEKLDQIVSAADGRLYPAKDARMPRGMFLNGFPNLEEFIKYIDPKFSSNFWKRCRP
jgi:FAD/FMN-containing dehydrogenase